MLFNQGKNHVGDHRPVIDSEAAARTVTLYLTARPARESSLVTCAQMHTRSEGIREYYLARTPYYVNPCRDCNDTYHLAAGSTMAPAPALRRPARLGGGAVSAHPGQLQKARAFTRSMAPRRGNMQPSHSLAARVRLIHTSTGRGAR